MAKKKSSTAKKTNVKKAVKKAVKKVAKKTPVKKSAPKAAAKKKIAAPKKAVKKAAPKKVTKKVEKKAAKKAVKKAPAAKAVKPAASVNQHLVKSTAPKKVVDLSDFITPLDDRLIVQTSGAEKMTAGGLYIPDTVADVSGNLHGTVVAIGRGHVGKKGHLRPMDVKLGDKVVFSQYSGSKINIQNEDLIILRENEVMGVVSK